MICNGTFPEQLDSCSEERREGVFFNGNAGPAVYESKINSFKPFLAIPPGAITIADMAASAEHAVLGECASASRPINLAADLDRRVRPCILSATQGTWEPVHPQYQYASLLPDGPLDGRSYESLDDPSLYDENGAVKVVARVYDEKMLLTAFANY